MVLGARPSAAGRRPPRGCPRRRGRRRRDRRGAGPASARRPHHVHRLAGDRPPGDGRVRRAAQALDARARRQVAPTSSSPTPTSTAPSPRSSARTFRTAGQACSAGTRLLVQRAVHDGRGAALAAAVGRSGRPCGSRPGGRAADLGPPARARARRIAAGVDGGARAAVGGSAPSAAELQGGFFVEPTVLDGVSPEARSRARRSSGRCCPDAFDADEEAVELANDIDYGLVAGVWTRDIPAPTASPGN